MDTRETAMKNLFDRIINWPFSWSVEEAIVNLKKEKSPENYYKVAVRYFFSNQSIEALNVIKEARDTDINFDILILRTCINFDLGSVWGGLADLCAAPRYVPGILSRVSREDDGLYTPSPAGVRRTLDHAIFAAYMFLYERYLIERDWKHVNPCFR